jgi:leader peptidase (prepilin peptidase)/N-methyltransferase
MLSQEEVRFFSLLGAVFSLGMGACIGSFLNVCIWRLPRGESIVSPGSHCPKCNSPIPWYCNIPVISWCALRGRCLRCKAPISIRYTIVELLTAQLFLLAAISWLSPGLLALTPSVAITVVPCHWLVISGLLVGTFIDLRHYIIPDSITIGGMVAGVALSVAVPALHKCSVPLDGLKASLVGMGTGFGLLYAIGWLGSKAFKKDAMGFGDVKLMGAIGAFFGWQAVLFVIFVSSFIGSAAGLILMACGKAKRASRIPFGPYLAAAALIWMFWGSTLVDWYFSLMKR